MKPRVLEIPVRLKMPDGGPIVGSIVHVQSQGECLPFIVTKVWRDTEIDSPVLCDGVVLNASAVYPAKKMLGVPPFGYDGKTSMSWHDMYHEVDQEETDERMEGREDPVAGDIGDDGGSGGSSERQSEDLDDADQLRPALDDAESETGERHGEEHQGDGELGEPLAVEIGGEGGAAHSEAPEPG